MSNKEKDKREIRDLQMQLQVTEDILNRKIEQLKEEERELRNLREGLSKATGIRYETDTISAPGPDKCMLACVERWKSESLEFQERLFNAERRAYKRAAAVCDARADNVDWDACAKDALDAAATEIRELGDFK